MELLRVSAAEAAPVIGPRWSPIKIAPALSIGVHENIIAVTSSGVISSVDINQTLVGWMSFAAHGSAEREGTFDYIRELELVTELDDKHALEECGRSRWKARRWIGKAMQRRN